MRVSRQKQAKDTRARADIPGEYGDQPRPVNAPSSGKTTRPAVGTVQITTPRPPFSHAAPLSHSPASLWWPLVVVAAVLVFASRLPPLSAAEGSASTSPQTVILALGDSLTAGYNLPHTAAFPVRLQAALRAKGHAVSVINGGVSGDTSAGGLARLDWMLADHPDMALVAFGGNDALRGLPPEKTEANLAAILKRLQHDGVRVLLVGMLAPPNMGRDYANAFNNLYPRLAKTFNVPLYPFFLQGVAANPSLLQADGMHPTPEGIDVIVNGILPSVESLLSSP